MYTISSVRFLTRKQPKNMVCLMELSRKDEFYFKNRTSSDPSAPDVNLAKGRLENPSALGVPQTRQKLYRDTVGRRDWRVTFPNERSQEHRTCGEPIICHLLWDLAGSVAPWLLQRLSTNNTWCDELIDPEDKLWRKLRSTNFPRCFFPNDVCVLECGGSGFRYRSV